MVTEVRSVLAAWIGLQVLAWVATFVGIVDNWSFAFITAALALAAPRVAAAVNPAAYGRTPASGLDLADGPMELIGIARPFTEADRVELDRALDLSEATP